MALTFNILDWKVWFPTLTTAQPDVTVIPPLLRRRLSPLARAAVSVIMPLAEQFGPMPVIYVSRHGDLSRTLGLLEDLAQGELLSPTAFSLSVHNATAGLFSIQQGLTKSITALSCGSQELLPAIVEALGLCNTSEPKILCVFCDEPTPPIYAEYVVQPERSYSFACVIGQGKDWQLIAADNPNFITNPLPQSLQLMQILDQCGSYLALSQHWQLERCTA